jgi:hypothetical protein
MSDEKKEELSVAAEGESQTPLRIDEELNEEEILAARQRRKDLAADDDEETWTNQPSADAEREPLDADSDDEDDDDEDEEDEQARAPRKQIQSGRDVVCEELPFRAERAATRIKPYLTTTIVFELTNSGERFLFDWRESAPKISPLAREVVVSCDDGAGVEVTGQKVNVDTVIAVSEMNLMAIRAGNLNPQVGMLTDKIRVKGKVGPAVYVFNVIAPRPR